MLRNFSIVLSVVVLVACGGGGGASSSIDISVSVPTGVVATATSDSDVGVSWSSQRNAQSYVVYYSTTSPVTKSSTKSNPVNSIYSGINFSGAQGGTTYYFAVSASKNFDGSNDTDLSAEVHATTLPSTPSITVDPQNGAAQVSWNAAAGTAYKIYHSNSNNFTKSNGLATVEQTTASPLTVTGLTNGQPHYFAATAISGGLEGALSPIQAVVPNVPLAADSAPNTPQRFVADCFFATKPTFRWAKQVGATGYRIYHSAVNPVTTADAYYAVSTNDNVYTLFPFGPALSGTTYFVITALNGAAESSISVQISCP